MGVESKSKQHIYCSLRSGLAYGLGLGLGHAFSTMLFQRVSLNAFPPGLQTHRLLIGMILAFIMFGFGGLISGAIGGFTLPVVDRSRGRLGYTIQSAISMGVVFGVIFLILVFAFNIFTGRYGAIFVLVGVIFGSFVGVFLGWTTVGIKRMKSVLYGSVAGYGIGGIGLGYGLWAYLSPQIGVSQEKDNFGYMLLGLFIFGFIGGAALGYVYSRLSAGHEIRGLRVKSPRIRLVSYVILSVTLVLAIFTFRPVFEALWVMLSPHQSKLSNLIESNTVGTHWSVPVMVVNTREDINPPWQLDLAASSTNSLAMVWTQSEGGVSDIYYKSGVWNHKNGIVLWNSIIRASTSAGDSFAPKVAYDHHDKAHVVWTEDSANDGWRIMYSQCTHAGCNTPARLSDSSLTSCRETQVFSGQELRGYPTIAVDNENQIMVVWQDGSGDLYYANWSVNEGRTTLTPDGCLPLGQGVNAGIPILVSQPEGGFFLVFDNRAKPVGEIHAFRYNAKSWEEISPRIGRGHSPDVIIDRLDQEHIAWCGSDGNPHYRVLGIGEAISEFPVSDLPCTGRPRLALDSNNRIHIVWPSNVVENITDYQVASNVIYESLKTDEGWMPPSIINTHGEPPEYALTNSRDGVLHLALASTETGNPGIKYTVQDQYYCDPDDSGKITEAVLKVTRDGGYRPAADILPFCRNRYDQLVIVPNPDPAFSDMPPTPNGGFDIYADLVRTAKYEVLFTTMAYSGAKNHDSPGAVFADAIGDLYRTLKQNPQMYPRGMRVRILLGATPPIISMDLNTPTGLVLRDLRDAGVEEMVNPEIGWILEVAKYSEAWPHSHAKLLVIDGQTVVASGFNHEYRPLPLEHRSGMGEGDLDTGIQVTGPVAQDARRIFDELWDGSVKRHCTNITPGNRLWRMTCRNYPAVSDHVPEVMRYYLTGGGASTISMYRSNVYDEADRQIDAAFGSANNSIDILQSMFSMPIECNLNRYFHYCTFDHAPPFMKNLLEAAENNNTRVRILLNAHLPQGIENAIAIRILREEAKSRDLSDRVEIRFFNGLVHAKNALIDDQFVIVGSQNLHYTGYGSGWGLVEYSLGVSDPRAVEEFSRLFEYFWSEAGLEDF